jgi:hypothetical protein
MPASNVILHTTPMQCNPVKPNKLGKQLPHQARLASKITLDRPLSVVELILAALALFIHSTKGLIRSISDTHSPVLALCRHNKLAQHAMSPGLDNGLCAESSLRILDGAVDLIIPTAVMTC